jgi:hypothetical protein
MSELDSLTDQFERNLKDIQAKYPLEDWRYAMRKIIYFGTMRILQEFPEIAIGPPPKAQDQHGLAHGGAQAGGPKPPTNVIYGQKPPYRPSAIGELVCIAVGSCPPPQS